MVMVMVMVMVMGMARLGRMLRSRARWMGVGVVTSSPRR